MNKSVKSLMQQQEQQQQQNSGEMSSEHQSSEDVRGESTTTIDEAAIDGDADYTDDNNFESNLRRRKGKIISCAKETIEHASRQLRRKVPYAGHLMTPRRLWLNKIPTQCDVVIEFPENAPDEALRWLLARIRSQPTAGLGLVVQVRAHESSRRNAFYISAPTNTLFKAAEELRLPKRLRPDLGGALREFTTRESHCFQQLQTDDGSTTLFTSQERQWLVLQVLQGLRASQTDMEALQGRASVDEGQSIVAAWQESGLIMQIFPLHETKTLTQLQKSWVKQIFAPQPLDDIAEYFGVKIALYFAWLGHYTSALSIPAIFGFLIYIIIWGRDQMIQDMGHVLFSLFNVAWTSLYLEAWKRYSIELAFRWGTLSMPPELLEPPRPLYKGTLIENNVTGRLEPMEAPTWKRRAFRYFVSFPIIGLCLLLVFVVMFIMLRFQDWLDSNHLTDKGIIQCMFNMHKDWFDSKLPQNGLICCLSVIPKVFLAGAITFMDEAYFKLAVWLNDKENYRLQSKYENHLIGKVALFQFVNSFLSLFYIAFYLRDEEKLKEQLAGLLISRQIIGNLRESAIPYFVEQWRLAKLSFNMWGALSPTQHINRTILNATNGNGDDNKAHHFNGDTDKEKLIDNIEEIDGNTAPTTVPTKQTIKKSLESLASVSTQLSNISKANTKRNIGQAEIESSLYKYDGTFSDHLEMLVQMGYVVLFSAAFPLAGVCALINNLLEIRSDAFKLAHVHQRPFGQRVANIGTWQNALSFLSLAAVIVNCALIGLSGQVSRLWPGLTTAQTIILIVTLEHIMLGLRSALTWLLPELPAWLAAEIARAEHCRREMQVKGTSPRPTPPSTTSTPADPDMVNLHLNGTGRITEIGCEISTTTTTTNDPSLTSQMSEELLYQQDGRTLSQDYEPFIDEIARYGLQRNVEADVSVFESRDSTPDSPPSQTSTILIRPLHESTPPNSGTSLISLNDGSSGACKSLKQKKAKIPEIPPFRGRSFRNLNYIPIQRMHVFMGSSNSALVLNATATQRQQQERLGMHIPEIPPYRKKKSNDSAEHTGGSSASSSSPPYPRPTIMSSIPIARTTASSISSLPASLTSNMIAMGPMKITEIPPYRARKISTESASTHLNLTDKHVPKAHAPEWMSRLKVNDHPILHRSIDCIAKELQSQQDNVEVLKPAPSWSNVAIKSASTADTPPSHLAQSQSPQPPTSTPTPTSLKTMAHTPPQVHPLQLSTPPSSSSAGPINGLQRIDFVRGSISSIPSSMHLHHQQHSKPKPPSSLLISEKEQNVKTKMNIEPNVSGSGTGSGGSASGTAGNGSSTTPSGSGWGGDPIIDEEAKAAELAAKKNRLKQKLVKSARSVAIFSLKLKERRQRDAEKAAAIAIEHAKALAKMPPQPQPGGELSLVPIEQLIQIEDIKPLIMKAASATTAAATPSTPLKMSATTTTIVTDSSGSSNSYTLVMASQSPATTIPAATGPATTTTNNRNSPTTAASQLHQQQHLTKQQLKQQHLHHPYSQSGSF